MDKDFALKHWETYNQFFSQLIKAAQNLDIVEISTIFLNNGGVPQNGAFNAYSNSRNYRYGHYNTIIIDGIKRRFYVSITYDCYWESDTSLIGGSGGIIGKRGGWRAGTLKKIEIVPSLTGREHERYDGV
jgi:hypothetical protein